jgi:hypothetical protein
VFAEFGYKAGHERVDMGKTEGELLRLCVMLVQYTQGIHLLAKPFCSNGSIRDTKEQHVY